MLRFALIKEFYKYLIYRAYYIGDLENIRNNAKWWSLNYYGYVILNSLKNTKALNGFLAMIKGDPLPEDYIYYEAFYQTDYNIFLAEDKSIALSRKALDYRKEKLALAMLSEPKYFEAIKNNLLTYYKLDVPIRLKMYDFLEKLLELNEQGKINSDRLSDKEEAKKKILKLFYSNGFLHINKFDNSNIFSKVECVNKFLFSYHVLFQYNNEQIEQIVEFLKQNNELSKSKIGLNAENLSKEMLILFAQKFYDENKAINRVAIYQERVRSLRKLNTLAIISKNPISDFAHQAKLPLGTVEIIISHIGDNRDIQDLLPAISFDHSIVEDKNFLNWIKKEKNSYLPEKIHEVAVGGGD